MKKYILFFFIICLANLNCVEKNDTLNGTIERDNDIVLELRSLSDFFVLHDDIGYFYSAADGKIYFAQYPRFSQDSNGVFHGVKVYYDEEDPKISVRDNQTDSLLNEFSLDGSVYGIGYYSGDSTLSNMLVGGGSELTILHPNDPGNPNGPSAVECDCFPDTDPVPNNCTGGGSPGAIGCSVSSGGSVGVGWDNSCSVSCASTGYIACCTRDAEFTYD